MDLTRNEIIAWAGGGVVLVVLAFLALRYWRRRQAQRALLAPFEAVSFDLLRDVLVPDGSGGQVHLDLVLLTTRGLLVVDLRDTPGMIFGSEAMDDWAIMDGQRRLSMSNPLGGLFDRMASVKLLAGEVPVDGRVVFTARASFPKGRPPKVTELAALTQELPAADRQADPSPVAAWRDPWERVKAAATPSPMSRRR